MFSFGAVTWPAPKTHKMKTQELFAPVTHITNWSSSLGSKDARVSSDCHHAHLHHSRLFGVED